MELETPDIETKTLSTDFLQKMNAYWRAANYISVGQIYLRDNPLLKEPLKPEHIKAMLLGHWGTTPGQNFIYVHLNRIIKKYDLNMFYISGPGHGGPALVGNTYLEGTYSEVYPNISQDEEGLKKLFTQFSFPGGIPSHVSPECPGSMHEGGELGYSLSHAFGAVFDNSDLIVSCIIGDGEAETGALATSWHSNKFLNPVTDGVVLPILHLNGYKISNPTILARISNEELEQLFYGYGWKPYFIEGSDPMPMHQKMAAVLDKVIEEIKTIKSKALKDNSIERPCWPMIILKTPKGWTGPKFVNGLPVEGTFRSHQVPITDPAKNPEHLKQLEEWLKSYKPEELFDEQGRLHSELSDLAPEGENRMGANPHTNGGILLKDLRMPNFQVYGIELSNRGIVGPGDTKVLGTFIRDIIIANKEQRNFRVFSPDETLSNNLNSVFEATDRQWEAETITIDEYLNKDGRVMEMLSENQCEGWLEGYLLTGRHGLFNCYEAFIHIIDSMFNQHAKWLKVTSQLPWRRKIASLNILLTSHVWRQDHNGFTHQDPGFIDHVINKKAEIVRVYLPPDANCLLSVMDHCLRSRHYVNVIVAGKHPSPQWLSIDEAVIHCTEGIGIWKWASSDEDNEPDVVMACAGDVPTLETLAAVSILRKKLPDLKIRVVNVVDLMKLQPQSEHPHGLSDADFDMLFTKNKPVIFAFHAYPWLIHRLTYRRTNHHNIHVRGYKEEGTITTAFDMTVLNDLDRFHLIMDVIDRTPQLGGTAAYLKQEMEDKLVEHKNYIRANGMDMPEVEIGNGKANSMNKETHNTNSDLVKDIIIGMSDGLTVPFALTASLSGVLNTSHLIIVSGLAEIAAGCISMGLGGYLSGESEVEHYETELKREYREIETVPELELKEVEDILTDMGVEEILSKQVASQISKDKNRWADFMMKLELKMEMPAKNRAAKSATNIALSYLAGGFIPLFPYIIIHNNKQALYVSCIVTIFALVIFGYFKSKVTGQPLIKGTIKVTVTGIVAATAAFLLAKAVS